MTHVMPLFSSPHVFEVRERMRLNGMPISKEKFAYYFFECWENFEVCDVIE